MIKPLTKQKSYSEDKPCSRTRLLQFALFHDRICTGSFALNLCVRPFRTDYDSNPLQLTPDNLWLCTNCRVKLNHRTWEDIPALSIANHLSLAPIPPAIAILNHMERRLTAPMHTFQRIVALPKGGQAGASGIAISFPFDVAEIIQTLPRPLDDSGIITIVTNIERAQPISEDPPAGHPNGNNTGVDAGQAREPDPRSLPRFYSVRWAAVLEALHTYKRINPLYADVTIEERPDMVDQQQDVFLEEVAAEGVADVMDLVQHTVALNPDRQVLWLPSFFHSSSRDLCDACSTALDCSLKKHI